MTCHLGCGPVPSRGPVLSSGQPARATFQAFLAIGRGHSWRAICAELRDLTNINQAAAAGIWQASAWRLERRFPKKWSRRVFVEQPKEGKPKAPKVIGFNGPGDPSGS
jgi:hypothetical protein